MHEVTWMEYVLIIGAFVLFIVVSSISDHRRFSKLATDRGDPNICEFARSFNYREIDTKIIREVWNEVQEELGTYDGKEFPVRADDLFEETYRLDSEDLDYAYWAIADRLGISTDNPESNPYWNRVASVESLVLFLHHQPRVENV